MNTIVTMLRNRLQTSSGRFVTSSLRLAVGFAIARVLGLFFSLLLGRVLPTSDYGYIQFSILLAGIIAIGTQPLMQHSLARFVSVNRGDPERLNRVVSTIFFMLVPVTLLTLALTLGYFAAADFYDIGALLVFVGFTIYYAYYGLARGFEDSARLSIVFIASNVVQFIALVVAYYLLGARSTLPALAIYGLSYVAPVIYLLLAHPLPVRIRPALIDRSIAREVVRFSIPVWFSHALYAVGAAIEVALLARLMGDGAAGVYAFTRTLCFAFDFLPSAIGTMIMPRAAVASDSRRLIQLSAALVLAVNALFGLVFIVVYPWFVGSFFDASYLLPNETVLIMIAAQTLAGLLGVVQSVTVGKNRPNLELLSRLIWVALLFGACLALIPPFGVQGAALASLITAVVGLAMFPILLALSRGRRADAAGPINQEAA